MIWKLTLHLHFIKGDSWSKVIGYPAFGICDRLTIIRYVYLISESAMQFNYIINDITVLDTKHHKVTT